MNERNSFTDQATVKSRIDRKDWVKTLYLGENGDECAKIVGDRIKAYRNKYEITQAALGDRAGGLKKNTISAYETGTYIAPFEFVIKMCVDAGITLDEFFGLRPINSSGDNNVDSLFNYFETATPEAQEYILEMARAVSKMSNKKKNS